MKEYIGHFGKDYWCRVSTEERMKHTYKNCTACVKHKQFCIKKYNQAHVRQCTANIEQGCIIRDVTMVGNSTSPTSSTAVRNQQHTLRLEQEKTPTLKAKKYERNIVKAACRQQIEESRERDMMAVFSTNQSLKNYSQQRKLQYGHYTENRKKTHIGTLSKYIFDKEKASTILQQHAISKDLGDRMRGQWTRMCRDVHLLNQKGVQPANGAQVKLNCSIFSVSGNI